MAHAKTEPAETATPASTDVKENKKMSRNKKILIVVGAVVAVFIMLVMITNSATNGAVSASNQMVNAIQAKDADLAYSLLTTEAKTTVTKEEFNAIVEQIGPILNSDEKMVTKSVNAETGKPATGNVKYEIQGNDGITYTFEINLQKEGDNWKVVNFDSSKK